MIRFLHTADWHIGQLFHGYDRTYEHQQFLTWLTGALRAEKIDVLLISGDVFDLSNPAAASVKMFYTFLNQAVKDNPALQIVIIAGNHDSASRLESPKPLLESSNIHITGLVERGGRGAIDYSRIMVPLKGEGGDIKAWCIAAPFLRMGDYPLIPDSDNPYTAGVTAFYKEAYEYVASQRRAGQAVIAMGHLHARQAEVSDMDKTERLIMGGVECISAAAFHEDICYVALGHIHKAQRIGGKEHIRYCGSPLPMSFSELHYKHQVIVFDLDGESAGNIKPIEVPVSIPLQRIPAVHSTLADVIAALAQLPETGEDPVLAPYLEVRVSLDGPEPALRHKVETALTGKHVRLAKIDVRYANASPLANKAGMVSPDQLNELQPLDVFAKTYQSRYGRTLPEELLQLFHQVTREVSPTE